MPGNSIIIIFLWFCQLGTKWLFAHGFVEKLRGETWELPKKATFIGNQKLILAKKQNPKQAWVPEGPTTMTRTSSGCHWWKEFPHGWGRQRVLMMPAFVILAAEDLFVNYYGWHLISHRRVTQWAWPGGRWTPDGALSFALHSTWYLIFLPIKEKHIPPPILVNQSNVKRPKRWIFSLMFNGRKGDSLKERKS